MKIAGRHHDFMSLSLGEGNKVNYWLPLVLGINGHAVVPFIDPRRASKHLTADARRFVFSVMHERIRVADPDFAEATLGIFQFNVGQDGLRHPILRTDEGVELYDFDTLDQMVRETYELWRELSEERVAEARKRGAGGGGIFDAA